MNRFWWGRKLGLPEEDPRLRLWFTEPEPTRNDSSGWTWLMTTIPEWLTTHTYVGGEHGKIVWARKKTRRISDTVILFLPFFFFSANILKLFPVLAQNSLITVNANMGILMVLLVNLWRYLLTAPAFWPLKSNCITKGASWDLSSPSWRLEKDLAPVNFRNGIILRSASWNL